MLSYTEIKEQFLRNVSLVGSVDTNVIADLKTNLHNRYQMVLSRLDNFQVQKNVTASTAASTQYYDYPIGFTDIDDVVVTVGSVNFPLTIINSQHSWDTLNAIQVVTGSYPQFIFPRSQFLSAANGGGYGLWPIPQGTYTITFYYHFRDRGLQIEDYTDGTIALTNASGVVTGTSTTFTADMVGRMLQVTSTTNTGWGYWYLVTGYTSATVAAITPSYQGATGSSLAYRIAQVPLLPDEAHVILIDGVTADFYMGLRKDMQAATWFNNKFWTGDGNNPNRDGGRGQIHGGLLGLIDRYNDRTDQRLVSRNPRINPLSTKVFATHLS